MKNWRIRIFFLPLISYIFSNRSKYQLFSLSLSNFFNFKIKAKHFIFKINVLFFFFRNMQRNPLYLSYKKEISHPVNFLRIVQLLYNRNKNQKISPKYTLPTSYFRQIANFHCKSYNCKILDGDCRDNDDCLIFPSVVWKNDHIWPHLSPPASLEAKTFS